MKSFIIFNENNMDLNETEKSIIRVINNNIDVFLKSNILELEKLLFYSKSSISRLCQKMGFKNLVEMKNYAIEKQSQLNTYKVEKELTTESRISNLIAYNVYTIKETLSNIDTKLIEQVCDQIKNSANTFCYGIGSSYLAAYELSNNLLKLGINSVAFNDLHVLLLALSCANKNNTLIIFSKSASHKEILFAIQTCKKNKIDVILITNNGEIEDGIKYKIIFDEMSKDKRLIATSSKISMLVISDLLYYELYYKTSDSNKYLNKANQLIEE